MIKQYTNLFFESWRKAITLLSKPYGVLVLFGLMLIGGFAISFWQRNVGYNDAQSKYSKDINSANVKIKEQDEKINNLQYKIDNFDCIAITQKYILYYQNLERYVTEKKESESKSLESQRKKTIELEKTLKTL